MPEQSKPFSSLAPGQVINAKYAAPCAPTKEGMDVIVKWMARGEQEEAALAMIQHRAVVIQEGQLVRVIDPGIIRTEIRPSGSLVTCFVPREIVSAWIR
jgi:hypothetical protein